ncbi:long-chain acyl-CoA synthetase [Novosphingobium sp. 1529]|uniref:fatty acid--CoA ligase n=1 Tax=Novosphingobium sp. 1529 TaxID=3156424 RepID=UPI0033932ED5
MAAMENEVCGALRVEPAVAPAITDLVERHARENPDRMAFSFEGVTTTFAEQRAIVERTATALLAQGVQEGDRIVYLGKNIDRYFFLLFAAARIGAVMVPVGWRLAPAEIAYVANDADAVLFFTDGPLFETAMALHPQLPTVRQVIPLEPVEGQQDFAAWIAASADLPVAPSTDRADRAFLQLYTSGTTGRPKGVILNARNLFQIRLDCARAKVDWDHWNGDDVALIAMPVAHIGGTGYGLMSLYHGAGGQVKREFSPEIVLHAIRRERVSKLFIVPTALRIMIRHPDARQTDYSRIRHILYGASPMPLALMREALEVIGAGLVQNYGMTETAGTVVALDAADHDPRGTERMKSAGRPLPGVELRIVDQAGAAQPVGTVGEIEVRSSANMMGYWKQPEATAKTLSADGWLRTGDAGYLDADGYLFICDRIKDMICSGGENVYPAEVEAVLAEYPAVAEAAVIGVPDPVWGEAVKAVVVARTGQAIDPGHLIAHCRVHLAGFKTPKSIDIVDALPRNATGKVIKTELRAQYWQGYQRQVN